MSRTPDRPQRSLARRLALYTMLLSGAATLTISVVEVTWEYRRDLAEVEQRFALVERSYLPSLTQSAWQIDRAQLQVLAEGVQRLPDVVHVNVRADGESLASSGRRADGDVLERSWPLVQRYRDRDVRVGEVTVQASLAGTRAKLADRIAFIVFANLLWIGVVAVFMFLLVQWLITRHLERIAQFVATSDPQRLLPNLALRRRAGDESDELGRLASALNATAAQVRASQDELRLAASVFEHAAEGIIITDAAQRILAVNPCFTRTTGYSAADAVGQTPRLLHSGRQDRAFYEVMWRAIGADGAWSGELWNRRKNGEIYPEWLSISAVRDTSGAVTHYIGLLFDLSTRHAAERALRDSEAELRLILESVPAIISYFDADLRYRFVNGRFSETFGLTGADVRGRLLREVLGETVYALVEGHFRQALEGKPVIYERSQRTVGGVLRRMRVHVVPHVGAQGQILGCYAMTIDVTKESQYREELERINRELERRVAERTAALEAANRELEAFSYTASHDLRAPLRHVAGFVAMLGERPAVRSDAEAQALAARAGAAARRLGHMVDELLRLARIARQPLQLRPVDLAPLVSELREELGASLAARRVEWSIGALPTVRADATLLRLVLQNLLDNALKYSRDCDPARIEVSASSDAESVTLCVRDNGVGFDMRYADKLFGTFSRLHGEAEFPGTGIGLAHVKRIVERHGGSVRAEGRPGEGAAFYVTLPNGAAIEAPQAASR